MSDRDSGRESMSGPEAAAYYSQLMKDRAASLPVEDALAVVGDVLRAGASLRRLIAGSASAADATAARPPSAEATAPRPAASEAPAASAGGTSPLATRVLTALMDMPDAEFLAMANKVVNRYYAAVAALAPEGMAVQVECMYCGKAQTHRVCQDCFAKHGPQPVEEPVHNVWALNCRLRTEEPIDNESCKVPGCFPRDYDG